MTDGNVSSLEQVRVQTEKFQKVVDDCLAGGSTPDQFLAKLQDAGATAEVATDYVEEFIQRQRLADGDDPQGGAPERPEQTQREDEQPRVPSTSVSLEHTVSEVNWQLLATKLAHASAQPFRQQVGLLSADLLKMLG